VKKVKISKDNYKKYFINLIFNCIIIINFIINYQIHLFSKLEKENIMLLSVLKNRRVWAFLGGVVAAKVIKSDMVHKMAVKGMANIKEEAEDLCYDEEASVVEA